MGSPNASRAFERRDEAGRCSACGCDAVSPFATLWPVGAGDVPSGADASLGEGLVRESRERIAGAVHERPASVDFLIGHADELMRERRLHEAHHLLDRAIAIAPDEFAVRLRRGECLAALGRYRDAFLDLERARARPSADLKSVAYHQELHRWVGEQMARKPRVDRATAAGGSALPLKARVSRWFARSRQRS